MDLRLDPIAFWIVATCILVSVSCGVLGCFLVLRRMSLLGDAISHAVLPGIALAFLITGSRATLPMLAGAMLAGVLTALLTHLTHRYAKVPEDAALGVVFTTFFALGVLLISSAARNVDLDADCVLYGVLEAVALDTNPYFGVEIPRVTFNMLVVTVLVLLFVVVFWKELKIVSFDPALATTLGINANIVHYLLMALVAAVTVAAFEAVGSILVVTMLIAPAATAHLLSDRLARMVWIAAGVGIASAILGRYGAAALHTSAAGMMSFAAFVLFLLAVLFAPRHGVLARHLGNLRLTLRIVREDVLAMLYRFSEVRPNEQLTARDALLALGGGWSARIALFSASTLGLVAREGNALRLTEQGRTRAAGLVRGHRLWETYLHERLGIPLDHVHSGAERMEHYLGDELQTKLAESLGTDRTDPHGRPIP